MLHLKCIKLSEKKSNWKGCLLYELYDFLEKVQKRAQWWLRSRSRSGRLTTNGHRECGGSWNHHASWLIVGWLCEYAFVKSHRTDCEKSIRKGRKRLVTDVTHNMPMSFDLMDNFVLRSQKLHCWINLTILSDNNTIFNCAYNKIHGIF